MKRLNALCADGDLQSRKLLQRGLEGFGYKVTTVDSGEALISLTARETPDVITLEVNLKNGPDGIEVCRELREWCKTPIIVVSEQSDKRTKLAAFEAGADDYVTKPFDMEELEARIRAILRRTAIEDSNTPNGEIHANGLVINFAKHRVALDGEEIHLTPHEFALLRVLAINAGKVVTSRTLLKEVWNNPGEGSQHYVKVYVNTLRKKLHEGSYIFTEPGVGYRFVDI
jgi:two-component system, OmpR family, KDP operon response regulator KdpE